MIMKKTIAQKFIHFLILVPKTAMISWQKLANILMALRPEGAENITLGSQVSDLCF